MCQSLLFKHSFIQTFTWIFKNKIISSCTYYVKILLISLGINRYLMDWINYTLSKTDALSCDLSNSHTSAHYCKLMYFKNPCPLGNYNLFCCHTVNAKELNYLCVQIMYQAAHKAIKKNIWPYIKCLKYLFPDNY